MLSIQVKLSANRFTPDQKSEIVTRLTDAMESLDGTDSCPLTSVVIEEVVGGELGVGGSALSTDPARASFASLFASGCM